MQLLLFSCFSSHCASFPELSSDLKGCLPLISMFIIDLESDRMWRLMREIFLETPRSLDSGFETSCCYPGNCQGTCHHESNLACAVKWSYSILSFFRARATPCSEQTFCSLQKPGCGATLVVQREWVSSRFQHCFLLFLLLSPWLTLRVRSPIFDCFLKVLAKLHLIKGIETRLRNKIQLI